MSDSVLRPDVLFEVSWEVCNKVGGIHTVLATKAQSIMEGIEGEYVVIGPDLRRDPGMKTEFVEGETPLSEWAAQAAGEGLRVRVGRWAIPGQPLAVLVDFTPFFAQKDQIFTLFWEKFSLDSLQGQWDYVEPVLFGYAAGRVIESLSYRHFTRRHRIVAQFHEWMTGSGMLQLRLAAPQVACVFTTHATVLGRSIAGNGHPLYSTMEGIDPTRRAVECQVVAKQSMESISAQMADAFTTVSSLTARECSQFLRRSVDHVTPNGFEPTFVPAREEYQLQRVEARIKLLAVAEAVTGHAIAPDSLIVATSGRYEYKNKGLDLFIDALAELNAAPGESRKVLAFMLIPAGHLGPHSRVQRTLRGESVSYVRECSSDAYVTHVLTDPASDPIVHHLQEVGLTNQPDDRVQVVFVPCYLNGQDGLFDMHYYRLLVGMDLTVFASYYEPWGYTPLESLAFRVPTVTTTLAGFGLWIGERLPEYAGAARVIARNDSNNGEASHAIADAISDYCAMDRGAYARAAEQSEGLSRCALWSNLVECYWLAYNDALRRAEGRSTVQTSVSGRTPSSLREPIAAPKWRRLLVQKNIPEAIRFLDELSRNLWWVWHPEAQHLFASIDEKLWLQCERNPVMLLESISYARLKELEGDTRFVGKLKSVKAQYDAYMGVPRSKPSIAYFSMEYGLHASLKLYSGGLGVLAGDYLKEASDRNAPLVAVGLFYRYGYFTQRLSIAGQQVAMYNHQNFTQTPATPVMDEQGNWITVSLRFPGREVKVRLWVVHVGRIPLYLLDTDFEENEEQDRSITHYLYGGNYENRFKQEMVLGVGGMRALTAAGFDPTLLHLNEGHAAFAALERLRLLLHDAAHSFDEAMELVRASSIFTTHTPVPAGHDRFPEDTVRKYMSHYPERLRISWEEFMGLGRSNPNDHSMQFSMSHLAAHFSSGINGVSMLHGEVSQKMFADLWPGYYASENHVGYVTNGVHYPTWIANEWRQLLSDGDPSGDTPDWNKVDSIPDSTIWITRSTLRARLVQAIRDELSKPELLKYQSPKHLMDIRENLSPEILTIGFARRFATYKRAHLLLTDLDRLAAIVNNGERPVQFLFAGKAHPHDGPGQDLIKRIFTVSQMPEFSGKLIFLPNYDMALAKHMVTGVDVWLNTPTRPQEASGTSGMKAVMNGVLHFSVLDGWWVEGYQEGAGWAIAQERTYEMQAVQDELDAEILYSTIENEIAPLFYDVDALGVPHNWIESIRRSMRNVAPQFSTTRMQRDYFDRYYIPQEARTNRLRADGERALRELTQWKRHMLQHWDSVEVIRVDGIGAGLVETNREYLNQVVIDTPNISPEYIGVELVAADLLPGSDEVTINRAMEYTLVRCEGTRAYYESRLTPEIPGAFDTAIRLFAKHPDLPHRMDFNLMRWV